ncbi:hypothetical protein AMATHDRAFT_75034 [Amanita thiersii Skay4041]|uniref:Velvet domain-containing protein n=1 Tax=Amanita thiersii Skay4041 TaxID=703135 RepID=A0A2A9NMI1_9AGAR|nr:hypothetical protein AMATHDRAFT_75034 [Amanita thiersii Skay4041]
MIQQTNPRQQHAIQYGPVVPENTNGGPEQWGIWANRKHYSLEVVQHPLRARMCGFGDKDRRPLAPAAVAKMVVRREDNSIVDVDEVDCSFFLVTVDLWSADGKQEMNLVLHPSSVDRYVPSNSSKARRRGTSTSAQHPRTSGNQTPAERETPMPAQYRSGGEQIPPPPMQNYYSQPMTDGMGFQTTNTYSGPAPGTAGTWAYPQAPIMDRSTSYPPPILPSIHSFGRPSAPSWHASAEGDPDLLSYRNWEAEAYSMSNYASTEVDTSLRPSEHESREHTGWSQPDEYSTSPTTEPPMYTSVASVPAVPYGPPLPPQPTSMMTPVSQAPYYAPALTQHSLSSSSYSSSRHIYTRTLVGPLSANACRLLDEHRKPGIFFLFQDLSVRTEGTFRLRMRLMNVGAPPAPEAGATEVHIEVSPVLAQTFTEPFTVYSAKRFPGVPDTTALSIAFGNQGQKLPLRNRHNKRRQRDESDDSEGESDEA